MEGVVIVVGLINLVSGFCYVGLQPAVTKRIGTAAHSKSMSSAATLLGSGIGGGSCYKRIATAARRDELGRRSYKRAI